MARSGESERRRADEAGAARLSGRVVPAPARSRWLSLVALTVVSFLLLLEDTAVSVALPNIRADLGIGLGGLEWIVNAYTLALAVLVLPAGKLADAHGRRRAFIAGLVLFTFASLAAGLARSGEALIAARALQGTGAAFSASSALAIISASFPKEERGAALGVWAGASAVGLAVGPWAGAMLTEMLGWDWVFLVNVPFGILAIATARLFIAESSVRARSSGLPWLAVALWAGVLASLLTALTNAAMVGWVAFETIALLLIAVLLLSALITVERHARRRLVDPSLLHDPRVRGANLLSLLSTAVMCNLFFFIPLYLQLVLGYSVVGAGTALLPLTATIVVVAPIAGRLSDRIGRRAPIVAGLLLLAAGLIVLSKLGEHSGASLIVGGLALAGVGIGLLTSPITAAALDGAAHENSGESSGLLNTSRMVGLSLGIAVMGAFVAGGSDVLGGGPGAREAFVTGLSEALLLNAGIALSAVPLAVATLGKNAPRRARGLLHGKGIPASQDLQTDLRS